MSDEPSPKKIKVEESEETTDNKGNECWHQSRIFGKFNQFLLLALFPESEAEKKDKADYEEARKRITNELLSMPSGSSSPGSKSSDPKASDKPKRSKEEIEAEEREKMQVLVSNFTEDQLDRYEMYRRAAFPKTAIKRIMQTITGCSVGHNVVIAMAGISKVFAGEVVEEGLDYMESIGESGPLKPKHLREAARRIRNKGYMPRTKTTKVFQP